MLEVVSVQTNSHGFLLCLCVSLLWLPCNSTTTTSSGTSLSTEDLTSIWRSTTTQFHSMKTPKPNVTLPLAPDNVGNVTVVTQNESSITLMWEKVNNILTYTLQYDDNGTVIEESIAASTDGTSVQHVVYPLNAGRRYWFTLITEFEGVNSTGYNFKAVTAPQNTKNVTVVTQDESSITLLWDKVDNNQTYTLQYDNNGTVIEESIAASTVGTSVQHVVSPLNAGRRYWFTLITEFEGLNSTGYNFTAVTAPRNTVEFKSEGQTNTSISLKWLQVIGIQAYRLLFNDTVTIFDASKVTHTVSGLESGNRYQFTLRTVFENVSSSGVNLTAVTVPENVKVVTVLNQTETTITVRWETLTGIGNYSLSFDEVKSMKLKVCKRKKTCTRVIPGLTAGKEYRIKIISDLDGVLSDGHIFNAVTVPPPVKLIIVTERLVNAVILNWRNFNPAWTYTFFNDDRQEPVFTNGSLQSVTHIAKDLQPGTKYTFKVVTTFFGFNSSAGEVVTVTVIDCSRVNWNISSTSIQGRVHGLFTNSTATNKTSVHTSAAVGHVSFTDLYPGARYDIYLEYLDLQISPEPLPQCHHRIQLLPSSIGKAHCEYWGSGYSLRVVWDPPNGLWTNVEVNVTGRSPLNESNRHHAILTGFQPAQTYELSVGLFSGNERSERAFVFDCSTDPRGVIAGSVMAVLLFIVLVCAVAFIILKRPDLIRKKEFIGESKPSAKREKVVPITKFPEHFTQMSLDEDRGFGQEYESLSPLGTEQTRRVAESQNNRPKNRFINVLPYDWSRVKLSANSSDYINASYMPGYNSSRDYIATQGPLPSTVADFWTMIWEQRVKGIVMVTNCTENGKIKCEQYWPESSQSQHHGELLVTTSFEQNETNWTLREFKLKHQSTSEERTVQHFHFTAWPDHGVPQGTEALTLFRGLVRQHIEREGMEAPTVVHCSAGVGRTGTIIALDVMLQQLEKERAVGIKAFVHRMRLNRPYMVQTESQYVFLHQCIMDHLQQQQRREDCIYENVPTIYANATALRELT